MIREELQASQLLKSGPIASVSSYDCPTLPIVLLPNIHDQQFYLSLVTIAVRLARESGMSAHAVGELSNSLLKAKGLLPSMMLPEKQQPLLYPRIKEEVYNPFEKGCSTKQQLALLKKMESDLLNAREKQLNFRALKNYASQKQNQIAPMESSDIPNRKDRFKRIISKRSLKSPIDSSDFYKHGCLQILKNSFKQENQCYQTLNSFVHLKTMYGHSIDEQIQNFSPIFNAIFDKTQKLIITGGQEGLIKIWSKDTGLLISNLKGHQDYINKIEVSKCNKYLISSAADGVRFYDLRTMKSLGGMKAESIIDIASIYDGKYSTFMFTDTKNLYLLEEKVMLARSQKILTEKDLQVYQFSHLILRDNVKMNIIAPTKDWKYVLLGFQNGQIILFKYSHLKQQEPNFGPEPTKLPYLYVFRAHSEQVMQIRWNSDGNHFVTGGKQGLCLLWQFKNQHSPILIQHLQVNKAGKRKKKRAYACNYIYWNCTHTHFIAGYHQILEEDDLQKGSGDIIVYNFLQRQITCKFSDQISIQLATVKAMDAHPYYPNIVLICQGNGQILLFDIFLKCIVNIFQERGYHLSHPQFSLIPGDCRFAEDGLSFLVSTEYGSVSLYGYDIPAFYKLCPTQQFLITDFEKFIIEDGSMKALPLLNNYEMEKDINEIPRGPVCNIRGQPYQHCLQIDRKSFLNNLSHPVEPINHINSVEVPKDYEEMAESRLKQEQKSQNFYQKNIQQIEYSKQTILFHERERQSNIFDSSIQQKMSQLKITQKPKQPQKAAMKDQNHANAQRRKPRSKLIRMNERNNYAQEFDYGSNNEESFQINDEQVNVHDQSDIVEEDEEYTDSPIHRRQNRERRYNTRDRNHEQKRYLHEQNGSDSLEERKVHLRRKSVRQDIEDMIENEEFRHAEPRKRVKRNMEFESSSQNQQKESKQQKIQIEKLEQEQEGENCYRCDFELAQIQCKSCPYGQKFCQNCHLFRGKMSGGNFFCHICTFLKNRTQQMKQNLSQEFYRLPSRTQVYIPQIDDEVRFFFQGYEQFLGQNIKILNKSSLTDVQQFRILPHTEYPELLNSPLCKVFEIKYYFPVVERVDHISNMNKRRDRERKEDQLKHIQMLVGLEAISEDKSAEICQFYVYFLPNAEFLLREEEYQRILSQNCLQQFEADQLIKSQGQELQIVECAPSENKFPLSIWKYIKVRKAQGKRLRGSKEDDKNINIWKIEEQMERAAPYISSIPAKHSFKLGAEAEKIINQGKDYEEFYYFVDFSEYPSYRLKIQLGICLSLIVQRLKNNFYRSYKSLEADIERFQFNSQRFNGPQSPYTEQAHRLRNYLLNLISKEGSQASNSHRKVVEDTTVKKRNKQLDQLLDSANLDNFGRGKRHAEPVKQNNQQSKKRSRREQRFNSSDYQEKPQSMEQEESSENQIKSSLRRPRRTRREAYPKDAHRNGETHVQNEEKRITRSRIKS